MILTPPVFQTRITIDIQSDNNIYCVKVRCSNPDLVCHLHQRSRNFSTALEAARRYIEEATAAHQLAQEDQ